VQIDFRGFVSRPASAVLTSPGHGAQLHAVDTSLSGSVPIRRHLATLTAHLVVALVALVVIGGATRVMQAGLA
jgi:hypothetical protein